MSLTQLLLLDMSSLKLSLKALLKIVTGRNPYLLAKNAGRIVVSPD
jgi:hypothetical protein